MDLNEYKKLIHSIYNDEEDVAWIPSVSQAKEKMLTKLATSTNKSCDISSIKKNEIETAISGSNLIYCDQFTLKLYGDQKYTAKLYERINKTPNGFSCSIDVMIDVNNDNRFNTSSWATLFRGKTGYGLTYNDVVDICRWLNAVKKLTSFI